MNPVDAELAAWVQDARARTLTLVEDLDDEQLLGPRLAIVNPLLWEIGHVAWFQEKWILRDCAGHSEMMGGSDGVYDSATVAHDTRWELPLPTRGATLAYLNTVRDAVLERLAAGIDAHERYFVRLAVFHEDMHDEAFAYTRQTHGWGEPRGLPVLAKASHVRGDLQIAGGRFQIGALRGAQPFVFDNEKWAHEVEIAPFTIARTLVTDGELEEFVNDRGYQTRELWSDQGWAWREAAGAEHPAYWRRAGGWQRRTFREWKPLDQKRTALHVNWHEAQAYCRWARRRLPTEAEWELAAPRLSDARNQAWQWCETRFVPYPGFEVDPYKEYSVPWFGTHKVLRGGSFVTQPRLLRDTWRNFYTPDRRDVWAGFRTCKLK